MTELDYQNQELEYHDEMEAQCAAEAAADEYLSSNRNAFCDLCGNRERATVRELIKAGWDVSTRYEICYMHGGH